MQLLAERSCCVIANSRLQKQRLFRHSTPSTFASAWSRPLTPSPPSAADRPRAAPGPPLLRTPQTRPHPPTPRLPSSCPPPPHAHKRDPHGGGPAVRAAAGRLGRTRGGLLGGRKPARQGEGWWHGKPLGVHMLLCTCGQDRAAPQRAAAASARRPDPPLHGSALVRVAFANVAHSAEGPSTSLGGFLTSDSDTSDSLIERTTLLPKKQAGAADQDLARELRREKRKRAEKGKVFRAVAAAEAAATVPTR